MRLKRTGRSTAAPRRAHLKKKRRSGARFDTLAKALTAPPVERYRFASTTQPGVEYELTIDGADVICSCRGFEYRGQCRHARDLKAALAEGQPVPDAYRPVSVE